MKKLIALILSLTILLSLAACAPGSQDASGDPTDSKTEPSTNATEPDPTNSKPTEPKPTEPEPTEPESPPELAANGLCAVGVVDAEAGTAKILADNGAIAEIPYVSEGDLRTGMIYEFAKNGDVYTLTPISWYNGDTSAWAVRTIDNSAYGTPDQLYTHDGVNETWYDLTEDCVIFCRFSDTEYRIFRGSDAIVYGDWPCACYLFATPDPNGGNLQVSVMLVCSVDTTTWQDGHADEANTYFFDPEGFGWSDGDLIIE